MKKFDLKDGVNTIKAMSLPNSLRTQILRSIESLSPSPILSQLRVATVLSLLLFLVTVSGTMVYGGGNNPISVLDVAPVSFVESVVLTSNGLSSDLVLSTLMQPY